MRILFISYAFHPSVGGIESSAQLFLERFRARGHEVRVVTEVELGDAAELDWPEVFRRPDKWTQWRMGRWADVIYHHNPAFTYVVSSLAGSPTVCSIRTWVSRTDGRVILRDQIKRTVLSQVPCIANSRATAQSLAGRAEVIENAYDDKVFVSRTPWEERQGAAFVGRLVSDKGVSTALEAIAEAAKRGLPLALKVIGVGPEEDALKRQADALGIEVDFLGRLDPKRVAEELNRVKYLLVPSKWAEPFGIVALEGIACGCIPIGTNQGGLVDAIGSCGPLFERGDASGLADRLCELERDTSLVASYRASHAEHLAAHSPAEVADRYLKVFERAISKDRKGK